MQLKVTQFPKLLHDNLYRLANLFARQYNYDPVLRDARSCGTTASLCGVEKAIAEMDATAYQTAVRRVLFLHHAMAFLKGFPMLNCGDEIGQLNGWDYRNDPARVHDSRNLHRTAFDWEKAERRKTADTLQAAIWEGLVKLRTLRNDPCFEPNAAVFTLNTGNPAVLAIHRCSDRHSLTAVFNFSDQKQTAYLEHTAAIELPFQLALAPYEIWLAEA